jgi:hypothetical protein
MKKSNLPIATIDYEKLNDLFHDEESTEHKDFMARSMQK